ncbi:MAG: cell division protein FtsW [Ruminococcaceae bacterium]|nr:cell division protein FtsW [Oscillospiraceae bacterium]
MHNNGSSHRDPKNKTNDRKPRRTAAMTATSTPKMRIEGSVDGMFLILIILLLCIGTVMVFSASYAYAQRTFDGDSFHYVRQQAIFVAAGLIGMAFVAWKIDYLWIRRCIKLLFYGSFVLLVLVLIPGVGVNVNGATRWINIGFQFQPSEVMKTALILYFADYNITHRSKDNRLAKVIYSRYYPWCKSSKYRFFRRLTPPKNRMKTFWTGIFPYALFLVVIAVLLKLQPHMSCLIIIGLETLIMMVLGQCSFKWLGAGVLAGAGGAVALLFGSAHSRERLETWMKPFSKMTYEEIKNNAWQPYQSMLAIGSGGLWGVGLGNSRQKHLFLPEPQNDYIFSILCEEMGFIFAAFVLLLFGVFIWRGFHIGFNAPDKFSKMIVIGIVAKIAVQVVLNIAVVTNVLPSTGIPLPFFSYGGTALLVLMGEMGIVLNVSKYSYTEK